MVILTGSIASNGPRVGDSEVQLPQLASHANRASNSLSELHWPSHRPDAYGLAVAPYMRERYLFIRLDFVVCPANLSMSCKPQSCAWCLGQDLGQDSCRGRRVLASPTL